MLAAWADATALASARARCGCQILAHLSEERPEDRDARADFGRECQRLWRCPSAGYEPGEIDPELAPDAEHVADVTGIERPATCPFATLHAGQCPSHAVEITEAVSLAADWHVPLADTLGRPLTAADVQALSALKRAQTAALASDRELAKRDAEQRAKRPRD